MKPIQFFLNATRLIVVLFIFLPFAVSAQSYDLTGYWQNDAGGCFQIRQNGSEVFWVGAPGGSVIANNVLHGAIAGNTLTGLWYDLPSNAYRAFGASLSMRIESNNNMIKVSESAPYKGSTWTRTSGPCNNDNPVGQVSNPSGGGLLKGDWDIKCCDNSLGWTLSITNQDGNTFSGTFSSNSSGGNVTGQLRGSTIEFDRSGAGWTQHWSGQLVNDGGGLRMVNGVWTGDYLNQFLGRNNWHAEKR